MVDRAVAPIGWAVKVCSLASRKAVARGRCAAAASGSELIEQKIPPLVSWFVLCCVCANVAKLFWTYVGSSKCQVRDLGIDSVGVVLGMSGDIINSELSMSELRESMLCIVIRQRKDYGTFGVATRA